MRNDVHLAALRAAARVAFSVASVAVVEACASEELGGETGSNESDLTPLPTPSGETGPTKGDASKPEACDAVLASAFPEPGGYQWEPVARPADVVACCDAALDDDHGGAYRWDCCVAYDPVAVPAGEEPRPLSHQHGLACTPWGPPVPPSMDRVAARRARFTRAVSGLSILRAKAAPEIA